MVDKYFTEEVEAAFQSNKNKSNESQNDTRIKSKVYSFFVQKYGLSAGNMLFLDSSNTSISLIVESTCKQDNDDNVLLLPPTSNQVKDIALERGIDITRAPLTDNFELDLDMLFGSVNGSTKVIWIGSPNFPSGTVMSLEKLKYVITGFSHKLVVIDERFIDFSSSPSFVTEMQKYPNVLILQSFEYAWGIAGLPAAVIYGSESLIEPLAFQKKIIGAQECDYEAILRLLENENLQTSYVCTLIKMREAFEEQFNEISFVEKVFPSQTDSIMIRISNFEKISKLLDQNTSFYDTTGRSTNCIVIPVSKAEKVLGIFRALEEI